MQFKFYDSKPLNASFLGRYVEASVFRLKTIAFHTTCARLIKIVENSGRYAFALGNKSLADVLLKITI